MDDLTGRVFGDWKVIGKSEKPYYWTCRCLRCGREKDVYKSSLVLGKSSRCQSCASSGPNPGMTETAIKKAKEKYLGKVVNGWAVLEVLPNDKKREKLPLSRDMPKMWKRDGHKADKIKQNQELCRVQPRPREKGERNCPNRLCRWLKNYVDSVPNERENQQKFLYRSQRRYKERKWKIFCVHQF